MTVCTHNEIKTSDNIRQGDNFERCYLINNCVTGQVATSSSEQEIFWVTQEA